MVSRIRQKTSPVRTQIVSIVRDGHHVAVLQGAVQDYFNRLDRGVRRRLWFLIVVVATRVVMLNLPIERLDLGKVGNNAQRSQTAVAGQDLL
jgi:hypothetical protein